MTLDEFHPAVRAWFEGRFPEGPTEPQALGWPHVQAGRDLLVAAPTGSGKTLSAFLVAIDRLYRAFDAGAAVFDRVEVVYVSPLKALAADIRENLERPLSEIRGVARAMGLESPELRVALRTGDTSVSERSRMLRHPPSFVITTPESLYLLVTSERGRALLSTARTVIVDEIHALVGDKRGSHLSLTLERLASLCAVPPQRVGLSATQRPIETVARFLVGAGRDNVDGKPACAIVDVGHRRTLDLALELPARELEAVASHEHMAEILDRIRDHVRANQTTLIFVNTRRMAERTAHLLAERLGEAQVAAHHGSLSKDRRLAVEAKLRAGELRALVATASLELGLDIGPVELVCQIGSPRSFATFLQRVGRSGHARRATPKGRLYPTTRDELVECAALLAGVRRGRLDERFPPEAPLDVLAQQVIAECAAAEWQEDALFDLVRRAAPYTGLSRQAFDEVLELVSEGVLTGRGRRGAYVHRDRVNGRLRGRRGARLAALTSGGAIPDVADYRVILQPGDTLVGTVNEDWAIESMAGDVFLLGSTTWRIKRVEAGVVRVVDAGGAAPTVPFWLGEAPARTRELSSEVSALRGAIEARLAAGDEEGARDWLMEEAGIDRAVAETVVGYLAAARAVLGMLPTQEQVIFERFFDDSDGMQLVIHAPFGGRINRAFGLALRKRFCQTFDFELQAAANDDAIVLSLGPRQSFALEDVPRYLASKTARALVAQAALLSPMFTARWRWNLNRSLLVLRARGGRKNPPPIQRMEAGDLLVAVFPALAACQENVTGPLEIPDHLLVRQTMHDCLHEAMDVAGLESLLGAIEAGRVRVHCRDTTEPSLLAAEILNGRPYTFLDDAPLEERRTRAVQLRRTLPVEMQELGRPSPEAIARVRSEATPSPRDADELHDLLTWVVVLRPEPAWEALMSELSREGRALVALTGGGRLWCAVEERPLVEAIFRDVAFDPDARAPSVERPPVSGEEAVARALAGHLELAGPVTLDALAARTLLTTADVERAVVRLEAEGIAIRGRFSTPVEPEVCSRRLLARIHAYTRDRLRREIEPVSPADFMRFLLRWQHVAPGTLREGKEGLLAVIGQLEGFEIAAGAWEESILPARVARYRPDWLDALCFAGAVTWARLSIPPASQEGRGQTPSRNTPIAIAVRDDLAWLMRAARGAHVLERPGRGAAAEVLALLSERGALFHSEIVASSGRLPVEIEAALWDLVARGWVTADGFLAVRALLSSRERWAKRQHARRRGLRRGAPLFGAAEGRWALLSEPVLDADHDTLAEAVAEQLLDRWGVVFKDLLIRESLALPWRDVLWAMRRLEARGLIRGGRFVAGFAGEQYALPAAVESLRAVRKLERSGEIVELSAADPLNLIGVVVPGPRVPAVRRHRVAFRDGAALEEPLTGQGRAEGA